MIAPVRVLIRSYQVGFGDCFLVTFEYTPKDERHVLIDFGSTSLPPDAPPTRMADVAANIAERCDGRLTAVVATHRHKDHVSGFDPGARGRGPGSVIAQLAPKLILQPWTENPKLAPDATGAPQKARGTGKSAMAMTASLRAMQSVAGQLVAEGKRGHYLRAAVRDELNFLGDDNLGNAGAVRNLMTMGQNEYLHAGKKSKLSKLLPGVEVHVLGPPTVDQSRAILKQRSRDDDEFWQLHAAAGLGRVSADSRRVQPLFPGHVRCRPPNAFPIEARWLIHHAKQLRGDQMLRIVRILDKAMNNTSLILLFRIGDKSLLFPGDAQIENWSYALDQPEVRDMLRSVDVYKVGHHGSLNATPKSLWALFERRSRDQSADSRLTTLMSTLAGKHGREDRRTEVPRRTLTAQLDRESNLISTQEYADGEMYRDTQLTI